MKFPFRKLNISEIFYRKIHLPHKIITLRKVKFENFMISKNNMICVAEGIEVLWWYYWCFWKNNQVRHYKSGVKRKEHMLHVVSPCWLNMLPLLDWTCMWWKWPYIHVTFVYILIENLGLGEPPPTVIPW